MLVDRARLFRSTSWIISAIVYLGWAPPAVSETLRGYAQVQYERLQSGRDTGPSIEREWWAKSFRFDYAARIGKSIDLNAQAQLTDLTYTTGKEASRVPFGALRLTHSDFGLSGSHRRTSQTDVLGVTTRQNQTALSGYWARLKWPRLNLDWIRRRTEPMGGGAGATSINRSASATHGAGPLALRAGYADQIQEPDNSGAQRVSQRGWNGGASFLRGWRAGSLSAQYDFSDTRRGERGPGRQMTQTHNASFLAARRFSTRTGVNATYSYRHTLSRSGRSESFDDNEGSLLLDHAPAPPFHLVTGGGVRTSRNGSEQKLEKFVLASATGSGPLRHGWTGGSGATFSANWVPGEPRHALNSYFSNTSMHLWNGMDVNGRIQVTVNNRLAPRLVSDSLPAPPSGRVVLQTNFGVTATPLRSISLGYASQRYRAGESLSGPASVGTTTTWDARWSPAASVRADGTVSHTKSGRDGGERSGTERVNLQWTAGARLQISGSYARSDRPRRDSSVNFLPGREVANVRILTAFSRELRGDITVNWVDPGTRRSARQIDVTLTQGFGG